MVLYVFRSNVHINAALLHRLVINKEKKAILFADEGMLSSRGLLECVQNFEKNKIFDKVCFPIKGIPSSTWGNNEDYSIKQFTSIYNERIYDTGFDLSEFDEIYTLTDNWDVCFLLYLNVKGIKHYWIQIAENADYPLNKKIEGTRGKLHRDYKAHGWASDLATPVLLSGSNKSISKCKKHYEVWNIQDCINGLTDSQLEAIENSYDCSIDEKINGATLLIKNSNAVIGGYVPALHYEYYMSIYNKNKMLGSQMALIDTLALDYYTNTSKLYIKPHPNDPLSQEQLTEFYGKSADLLSKIPMELISKILINNSLRVGLLFGYVSAALGNVSSAVYEKAKFGKSHLKNWMQIHDIYAAIRIAIMVYPDRAIYCSPQLVEVVDLILEKEGYDSKASEITGNYCRDIKNAFLIFDESFFSYECYSNPHISNILCFLDTINSSYFFDQNYRSNYGSVCVKKKKISKTLDPCIDTSIWFYSLSNDSIDLLEGFHHTTSLQFTGIDIIIESVSPTSLYNELMRKEQANQDKIMKLRMNSLLEISMKSDAVYQLFLREESELERYIGLINKRKDDYLVICIVKDTPGSNLLTSTLDKFHELGFSQFTSKQWASYIGILDCGNMLVDKVNTKEQPLHYENESYSLKLSSQPWRKGNKAEIIINGTDYAVNKRGINIVVWDKENSRLIDSVAFDAHRSPKAICFRK